MFNGITRPDDPLLASSLRFRANAATLASAILSLKADQTSVVEKAYYHRYHRRYYHRGYRGITVVITATAIFIAVAGGIKAIATAVGGTKTSTLDNKSVPKGTMDKYLCCNADESEPGAFKDRLLMQKNPHLLIEGCVIGSIAAGANKGFIFIRGEYSVQADILDAAVAEAYEKGYLGEGILDSQHSFDLVVHRGQGAYICGEETGLLDALEGKRGNPRLKPPFPANKGLYQGPTLINNVETLWNAPIIVEHGADWSASSARELDRHQARVGVRQRAAPGQLRGGAGRDRAGHHLRPRGRTARGARAEVLLPRRLVALRC